MRRRVSVLPLIRLIRISCSGSTGHSAFRVIIHVLHFIPIVRIVLLFSLPSETLRVGGRPSRFDLRKFRKHFDEANIRRLVRCRFGLGQSIDHVLATLRFRNKCFSINRDEKRGKCIIRNSLDDQPRHLTTCVQMWSRRWRTASSGGFYHADSRRRGFCPFRYIGVRRFILCFK